MIRFKCEQCGRAIKVDDATAGRKGKCPNCGKILIVPIQSDISQIQSQDAQTVESSNLSSSPPPLPTRQVSPYAPENQIELDRYLVPNTETVSAVAISQGSAELRNIPSPSAIQINVEQPSKAAHSLGIASLVLAIFSFFVCWLPMIGMFLSGIALLLGIGGIVLAVTRNGSGIGYSIAGTSVSAVSIGLALLFSFAVASAFRGVDEAIREQAGRGRAAAPVTVEENAVYSRFRIVSASLVPSENRFDTTPNIHIEVQNNTGQVVSRAFFRATYITPGRTLPWHAGDFNYEIPGGLEPGETGDWNLQPSMFGDWGNVETRTDAELRVEVVKLEGADGKPLVANDAESST